MAALATAAAVLAGCDSGGGSSDARVTLEATVLAGPACPPLVTLEQSPRCRSRPVEGATVVVTGDGATIRRVSDASGLLSVELPAGRYTITPKPVHGYLGTPQPRTIRLETGTVRTTITYDTGIREHSPPP